MRGLLIAATNRLAFVVTLVPRDRYQAERAAAARPGREFAPERGTPYGMYREALVVAGRSAVQSAAVGRADRGGSRDRRCPLGSAARHVAGAADDSGSLNPGGALTTASGLIFIGAARDTMLRAFDIETGKVLWVGELPASAQATPMTYRAPSGKQFVVIAAGGHSALGTKMGDHVVAFALP